MIFMGTPHRGSSHAVWAGLLSRVINTLTLSSTLRGDLLDELKTKSQTLSTISSQFVQRAKGLQIVSFYETKGIGLASNIVSSHLVKATAINNPGL
jgi:hypothetical protein